MSRGKPYLCSFNSPSENAVAIPEGAYLVDPTMRREKTLARTWIYVQYGPVHVRFVALNDEFG